MIAPSQPNTPESEPRPRARDDFPIAPAALQRKRGGGRRSAIHRSHHLPAVPDSLGYEGLQHRDAVVSALRVPLLPPAARELTLQRYRHTATTRATPTPRRPTATT